MNYWPASERCRVAGNQPSGDRINCRELGFKGRAGKRRRPRVCYLPRGSREINPRGTTVPPHAESSGLARVGSPFFSVSTWTKFGEMMDAQTARASVVSFFKLLFQFAECLEFIALYFEYIP